MSNLLFTYHFLLTKSILLSRSF